MLRELKQIGSGGDDEERAPCQQAWLVCGRQPRATPIVFGLRRAARSGAKSLTSSPFHCAREIIVNSIVTGMKLGGGINSVSIQSKQRERCGLKPTRKPGSNSWAEPALRRERCRDRGADYGSLARCKCASQSKRSAVSRWHVDEEFLDPFIDRARTKS